MRLHSGGLREQPGSIQFVRVSLSSPRRSPPCSFLTGPISPRQKHQSMPAERFRLEASYRSVDARGVDSFIAPVITTTDDRFVTNPRSPLAIHHVA
uniref:Uncharacterized protein n=1 Tax=Plectus sambesii TaxID=2011161 RepID=A0A914VL33_9BILA